jgi:signal transduction histidine kinase
VGLAVVKLLVEQSGGSLAVDSGEGQGTTFVVVLPRYETEDYL